MALYKGKYRIETTRLREWIYSTEGYYFVTICTRDKQCFFGKIIDDTMKLSNIGIIAEEEWLITETIRPYIRLDQWVVMPNHIHGIVVLESGSETTRRVVSATLPPNSLGAVLGQYKSIVTKRAHKLGYTNFAHYNGLLC